jgi:hypothetical protein
MPTLLETNLKPRQRTRLRQARENGYLDARGPDSAILLKAYGLWCWLLRLPVVWFERQSPYSRYGRVRLDLFTTANQLSEQGLAEMQGLAPGAADISPHDGVWSRVKRGSLQELAGRVMRAAVRAGNSDSARPRLIQVQQQRRGPAQVIEMEKARSVSA